MLEEKTKKSPILTVEGLSPREKEVFVYAFGEAGAVQCGFCIPGIIMIGRTWGIPEDAGKPADARIKSGKYIKNSRYHE